MKMMSFAEINDLENGQQISAFQGTLKKVFDQKSGEGQYGVWTLQNLILQDEHAHEITVTWTAEDQWNAKDEGKLLLFESGYDKKDQLAGIKRDIRRKDGKVYESVKVDERAKVRVLNGQLPTAEEPTREDEDPQIAPESSAEPPPARQNRDDGVLDTRKHLMQSANLLVLCIRAAEKAVAPHQPVVAQTSEQFQSDVAKLFIEASSRRTTDGVHWWSFVDKMPSVPLEPF